MASGAILLAGRGAGPGRRETAMTQALLVWAAGCDRRPHGAGEDAPPPVPVVEPDPEPEPVTDRAGRR